MQFPYRPYHTPVIAHLATPRRRHYDTDVILLPNTPFYAMTQMSYSEGRIRRLPENPLISHTCDTLPHAPTMTLVSYPTGTLGRRLTGAAEAVVIVGAQNWPSPQGASNAGALYRGL